MTYDEWVAKLWGGEAGVGRSEPQRCLGRDSIPDEGLQLLCLASQ